MIAYDLRGHGRSPWSGPHTLHQHTLDLDEVLEAAGVDQTALIGDGFGCRIALEYAAAHGERVTALSLLDPPLRPRLEQVLALAGSERHGQVFASADAAIASWPGYAGLHHTPRALVEEDVAEHLVVDQDGRLRFRYSHDAAAAALEALAAPVENLKEVVCPVLLVRGERSDLLTAADAEHGRGRSCAAAASRSSRAATCRCGTRWPRPARWSRTSSRLRRGRERAARVRRRPGQRRSA